MIEFIDTFAPKLRTAFVGTLVLATLVFLSLFISALFTNSHVQAARASAPSDVVTTSDGGTNIVTNGLGNAINDFGQHAGNVGDTFSASIRSASKSFGSLTLKSGLFVARGIGSSVSFVGSSVAFVGRGIFSSVAFVGHGVGSGMLFVIRAPLHVLGFTSHVTSADSVIKTSKNSAVPTIDPEFQQTLINQQNQQDQQKLAALIASQLSANEALGGSVVAGDPNHGGYPAKWDAPARQDSLVDSWGMYNRECVSYTAWKVYQTFGSMPYWGGVGNANQWPADARAAGISTGLTPKVHSVAISMHGYYGHAMWVEAVSGNNIYVSQYNYDLAGHYSEMWVNGSGFTYLYFK